MLHSLELKMKTVILMAKLRSHISVRRFLQQENKADVFMVLKIERIYNLKQMNKKRG
jgi:hypothetical protein